jgi:NitT/TauT family transport system substrate-binding protein
MKKGIMGILVLLMSLAVFVPVASAGTPLVIGLPTWVGNGPLYLARDKGYFKEQGLTVDLKIMDDITMRFAALYSKKLDGVSTVISSFVLLSKKHVPCKMVMALDDSYGGDGILAKKSIKTIKDLKGKTVAYKFGSASEWFLVHLLKKAGLSIKDIKSVNMEPGSAGTTFIAGKVDAAVTREPYLTKGKNTPHGHLLIDSRKTPMLIMDTVLFRDEVLKKRPDDVKKFIKGVLKAIDFYKKHPEESYGIMAKGIGGWLKKPKAFAETMKGVRLYDLAFNKKFFGTPQKPGPVYQALKERIEVWEMLKKLTWKPKPEDFFDSSFIASIKGL